MSSNEENLAILAERLATVGGHSSSAPEAEPSTTPTLLLSLDEAAAALGWSKPTVKKHLPLVVIDGIVKGVLRSDLQEFLVKHRVHPKKQESRHGQRRQ